MDRVLQIGSHLFWRHGVLALWVAALLPPCCCQAAAEPEKFLAALREQGFHTLALDFLDRMESSPLATDRFRDRIPFERCLTHLTLARQTTDADSRDKHLASGVSELDQLAVAAPQAAEVGEARMEVAETFVQFGMRAALRSSRLENDPVARGEAEQQARQDFAAGLAQYTLARDFYDEARNRAKQEDATDEDRNQLVSYQETWLRCRLYIARTQLEMGMTYAADSDERRQTIKPAIDALDSIFTKYDTYRQGVFAQIARFYQARCYQALGDCKQAITAYEDILAEAYAASQRREFFAEAIWRQAECLLAEKRYEELISRADQWLKESRPNELQSADWIEVQFVLAQALEQQAATLAENDPQQKNLLRDARSYAREISRRQGPHQEAAQLMFARLGRGTTTDSDRDQPQTFTEAFTAGRDAFDEWTLSDTAIEAARDNNPAQVANLQERARQSERDARTFLELTLKLAGPDTDIEALNTARHYLCWIYYQDHNYWKSAVLGEYLARQFPDGPYARRAAKVALSSYQQMYRLYRDQGTLPQQLDFEVRQAANIAEYITRRWPGTDDAKAAYERLIEFSIREDRLADARKLIDSLPPEDRAASILRIGTAFWSKYLRQAQLPADSRPDDSTLESLRREAAALLQEGFDGLPEQPEISTSLVAGILSLAQVYREQERFDDTLALLNHETLGPYRLIQDQHPAVSEPATKAIVYQELLRALVASTPPRTEEAVRVMDALEESLQAEMGDAASQRVTAIYVGLGRQLQEVLAGLNAAGRPVEAAQIAAAFEVFVNRIARRADQGDFQIQAWVARTYFDLGRELRRADRDSAQARKYFQSCLDTITPLVEQPELAPSEAHVLSLSKRRAECLRYLRRYQDAISQFSKMLAEKPMYLDVQKLAAYTYQEWGSVESKRYENAIHGGQRQKSDNKNRIWGWIRLASVAAKASRQDAKYRNLYFECRYNIAAARFLAARQQSGADREEQLAQAESNIRVIYNRYPKMGGESRKAAFDRLLKRIQKERGQPQVGLAGWKSNSS